MLDLPRLFEALTPFLMELQRQIAVTESVVGQHEIVNLPDPNELHDVASAARLLGVVPQTIHAYVKRQLLRPHRMRPGGKLYFKRNELVGALHASNGPSDKRRKANRKGN